MIIGINEDFRLGPGSKISDKGGFAVNFVKGEMAASALDFMDEDYEEGESATVTLFPPNMLEYKTEAPRTSIELMRDITTEYQRMYAIFKLYFTKEELKTKFPMSSLLEGLNITRENEESLLTQESVITKIFENMATAAIKLINDEKLWEKDAFRIKLLRQSLKKAFPRMTYKPKFGDWVELMIVPKAQSKVEFTKFELSKGYDDASVTVDAVEPEGTEFDEPVEGEPGATEDTIPELPEDPVDFN